MKSTHVYRVEVKTIMGWKTIVDRPNRQLAEVALAKCQREDSRQAYRIVYGRTEWKPITEAGI